MKRICYIVAVILTLLWGLSFFVLHAGTAVHVLLMIAVISWLHAVITCPSKRFSLDERKLKEEVS
jgi:hypothetical protein